MYCSPEFGVTGGGPRLHQRLELPGLGPALVVGDVRIQRPHQLAVLALRPQRRVDLEERLRRESHHLARHPGGDGVGLLGDEDDVHVADVVQLAGTTLAHRDHRQPRRLAVLAAHRAGGHLQRGGQCGVGHVRQMLADLGNGSTGSFSTIDATSKPASTSIRSRYSVCSDRPHIVCAAC